MIRYKRPIKTVVPLHQFLQNKLYFKHSTGLTLMELWKPEIQNETQSWKKSHQFVCSFYPTKVFFLFKRLSWAELTWIHLAHVAPFIVTAIIFPFPIWLHNEDTICLKGRGRGTAITKGNEEGVSWSSCTASAGLMAERRGAHWTPVWLVQISSVPAKQLHLVFITDPLNWNQASTGAS